MLAGDLGVMARGDWAGGCPEDLVILSGLANLRVCGGLYPRWQTSIQEAAEE